MTTCELHTTCTACARARRVRRFATTIALVCALEAYRRDTAFEVGTCDECGEQKPGADLDKTGSIGTFCSACRATRDCDTCGEVFAWKAGDDECTCGECRGYAQAEKEAYDEGAEERERGLELAQWVVELFRTFSSQGVAFELTDLEAKHSAEALIKAHRLAAAERRS